MKLVLLGTTGYHPNDRRHTACLMLPELGVVLDAGTSMFRVRRHLQTSTLDIFLTHAHLDHVIGLTFLFDVLHEKQMQHVLAHAEPEKIEQLRQHLFAPALFPVQPPFEFRDLGDKVPLPGGGRLTHFPLEHPGGSVGFRLDWPDRSMAYVTDTTAATDADYVEKIHGVDLLVHECYFADGQEDYAELTGHSCLTPTCEVAAAAEVGRLVLVHLNPFQDCDEPLDMDLARCIFPQVELGRDEMELEF